MSQDGKNMFQGGENLLLRQHIQKPIVSGINNEKCFVTVNNCEIIHHKQPNN